MHFRAATRLPTFLRPFGPGGKLTRLLFTSIELLERARRYDCAVSGLRRLLAQHALYATSRGRWWDRLALDLDRHLRRPAEALAAIEEALNDAHVVGGFRLALLTRGERLTTSRDVRCVGFPVPELFLQNYMLLVNLPVVSNVLPV